MLLEHLEQSDRIQLHPVRGRRTTTPFRRLKELGPGCCRDLDRGRVAVLTRDRDVELVESAAYLGVETSQPLCDDGPGGGVDLLNGVPHLLQSIERPRQNLDRRMSHQGPVGLRLL